MKKTGRKKFSFPKILPFKNIDRKKIRKRKKNSCKILQTQKNFLKNFLNAIIGWKKPETKNPDYAIFYEIKPDTAFLYFHPCTRKSFSQKKFRILKTFKKKSLRNVKNF
jgi:hypothetical protein